MSEKRIEPHEPDEELIGPEELEQDLANWERIIARKRLETMLQELENDARLCELLQSLVKTGVCKDEKEVIGRALETFFVAVVPAAERERVLNR
jgi:hypothetical protein